MRPKFKDKKKWLSNLKKQLIATLPKKILIDKHHGISAARSVKFVKKRWVIKYSYGVNHLETCHFLVKSRSLFKAVHKAHKRIIIYCVDFD